MNGWLLLGKLVGKYTIHGSYGIINRKTNIGNFMGYEPLNDFLTTVKFMKSLLPLHLIGPFLLKQLGFCLPKKLKIWSATSISETTEVHRMLTWNAWNWSFCITVSMLHTTHDILLMEIRRENHLRCIKPYKLMVNSPYQLHSLKLT